MRNARAKDQIEGACGVTGSWLSERDADDPAVLDHCYSEVEARMQAMLDELMEGLRPLLGRRGLPRAV